MEKDVGRSPDEIRTYAYVQSQLLNYGSKFFHEENELFAKLKEWGTEYRQHVDAQIHQISTAIEPFVPPHTGNFLLGAGLGAGAAPVYQLAQKVVRVNIVDLLDEQEIKQAVHKMRLSHAQESYMLTLDSRAPGWEKEAKKYAKKITQETEKLARANMRYDKLVDFCDVDLPDIKMKGKVAVLGAAVGGCASVFLSVILRGHQLQRSMVTA